jgi:hypothetical protein
VCSLNSLDISAFIGSFLLTTTPDNLLRYTLGIGSLDVTGFRVVLVITDFVELPTDGTQNLVWKEQFVSKCVFRRGISSKEAKS